MAAFQSLSRRWGAILRLARTPVGGSAFDRVCDVELAARKSSFHNCFIKQVPGLTYKGAARTIFLIPWPFAYQHKRGSQVSFAKNHLSPLLAQRASLAVQSMFPELLQRLDSLQRHGEVAIAHPHNDIWSQDMEMIRSIFKTGQILGEHASIVHSKRSVADLQDYWQKYDPDLSEVAVYRTQSWFCRPDGTEGAVLWASTVLYPGHVNGEFFMTRGHFHLRPSHGELIVVASGAGKLILADREGNQTVEELFPGRTIYIDGILAHRTVNDGVEPLIFWCSWPADCGHEYDPGLMEKVFTPIKSS